VILTPALDPLGRLSATSMFNAVYVVNLLTLATFRWLAIGFAVTMLMPTAVVLMLVPDAWGVSLGMSAVSWMALLMLVIETVYRGESRRLQEPAGPAPHAGLTPGWLSNGQIALLYERGVFGVCIAACLPFVIVYESLSRQEQPDLAYWLLGMTSIQTLRAASVLAYQRHGTARGTPNAWMLCFALGLLATVLAWYVFLWQFFPSLDAQSRTVTVGMLVVLAIGSVLSLTAVRWLSLSFMLLMLAPVFWVWLNLEGAMSMQLLLLACFVVGLLVVMNESTHRVSTKALYVEHMKGVAEHSEREARQLNRELSEARAHLQEANATLEQKVVERTLELERLANEDALTGLSNRHFFSARVRAAIESCSGSGDGFTIHFVDLDNFKELNDGLGHPAGDLILKTVAKRIRNVCGPDTLCARWGGDEFLLLQQGNRNRQVAKDFADTLLSRIAEPLDIAQASVKLRATIGVANYPDHGRSAAELIEHADIAVCKGKLSARGAVCFYQTGWGLEARQRLELIQALRGAIETDALTLNFQPVVEVAHRRLYGVEALARWHSPQHGFVSPSVFIPMAEEIGLMPRLGARVLSQACSTAQQLFPQRDGPIIAVNTSVAQLMGGEFVSDVSRILERTGLAPQRLELEVTESLFAGDIHEVKATLVQLRNQGIRISIDDFGTGYSSFGYLRSLPLDTLKIDRSFVKDLAQGGSAIFSTLIGLANSLGLEVIVEGVETERELDSVVALGARQVQGYYFAKPMPAAELSQWRPPNRPIIDLATGT
jgi:diguanylate cyclase (GGDEF)-like protein